MTTYQITEAQRAQLLDAFDSVAGKGKRCEAGMEMLQSLTPNSGEVVSTGIEQIAGAISKHITTNLYQREVLAAAQYIYRRYCTAPAPQAQPDWLLKTAQDLANSIRRRCFPEVPQFQVLDDLAGVISQIDNMTTGMERKAAPQAQEQELEFGFDTVPQPAQEPTKFLASGTRFKLSFDTRGRVSSLWNFMDELDGRWVALVAAENDCHLQSAQPVAQPAQGEPALYQSRIRPAWKDDTD